MTCSRLFLSLALLSTGLPAQRLDPSVLLKPLAAAWPTYNGDYSGRRYSALAQINATNVRSLSLQWIFRTKDAGSAWTIKSTPLETGGILYFTVPNNVWAVDARTGREIWHYKYPANEAIVIGNPATGKTLWHVNAAEFAGNGPITYFLNGRQYVVFAAGDTLYAFALPDSVLQTQRRRRAVPHHRKRRAGH